ncbi:AAA family ATPase [Thiocapsa rosea]|uniref:Putative ATP-binding protein involved in virulence n=1 Tax=Thiocapsa rosea TaxID=69360 RepID=A0A495V5U2_9GAMM|nr:AAA family ATPase [Thiocapsa rosea]RKT43973.1 putative ATP-binding protein involved in virulence [Thiocapsa rosea]
MYIEQLKLERFRGAQNLLLDFDERLNVFVGVNGAGKSSVLDAVALLLSWLVNRIKSSSGSGRPIKEMDIKTGEPSANLWLKIVVQEKPYIWNLAKVRSGHRKQEPASILILATEAAKRIQNEITDRKEQVNLPLIAYYPVNRAVVDIPLRIRTKHHFGLLDTYDESLTSGANFRTFFEWFREREDLENEARRDQQSLFSDNSAVRFPDPQLEAVRTALSRFMPDFRNLSVRRNPLRMEVDKNGERLTVNQLSDGEKCLMAMIGDLARRMAIANPVRDNSLDGEGVVLIDEIDLHLHPKWQRMLIPKLTETFPNCQFLISTHSPHVITHVRPENLFLLAMGEHGLTALRAEESYGKTVERVLEDLMGLETTRPDEVKDALRAIYEQIDTGDLGRANQEIAKLGRQIGNDPELSKAGVLIKRKELIGK